MDIILASKSPRRQELLSLLFNKFEVLSSDFEEFIPQGMEPENIPSYLAVKKAVSVSKNHSRSLVIGCDTIVVCEGRIFGKPKDQEDARNMLSILSGRTHTVYTGVCFCFNGKTYSFTEETDVRFYPLTEENISRYIETGEPFDKAGAYGIQGFGSMFVKGIFGDYFNVVGLPVSRIAQEIKTFEAVCGERIETILG